MQHSASSITEMMIFGLIDGWDQGILPSFVLCISADSIKLSESLGVEDMDRIFDILYYANVGLVFDGWNPITGRLHHYIHCFLIYIKYFCHLGIFVIRDDADELLDDWIDVLSEDSEDGNNRISDGEGV